MEALKRLAGPLTLPTTAKLIYTNPAGTDTIIKEILGTNYASTDSTLTVYLKASGSTALNDTDVIIGTVAVEGHDALVFPVSTVLDTSGDAIYGLAGNASRVNITISGVTTTG